jgi:transposase InsO family protein
MDAQQKKRLGWVKLHEETGDAGIVCRRCGISRPTLRKWLRRYKQGGIEALSDRSRKPQHSPFRKVFSEQEALILAMRKDRRLGVRRIQNELRRLHDLSLSLATIHKVLGKQDSQYLQTKRHYRKQHKRYSCKLPGERVQMDVCKIAAGRYQYTAIDDCTRWKVVALYSRRTAANTLDFLDQVIERMPFPIQRFQTDRGKEFFAYEVQERLMEWGIKFRPIKPGSPHLNGKVERTQRTDLDEFYATVDVRDPQLLDRLAEWEFHYNWHRPHSSLDRKTPNEKLSGLSEQTPFWDEVEALYDRSKERVFLQNYTMDQAMKALKQSL